MKIQKQYYKFAAFLTFALLLGLTGGRAAQFGINFEDEWAGDGGAAVTQTAFGIPASSWFNMVRVYNSESFAFSTNQTLTIAPGATLKVEWQAENTYSIAANVPTDNGDDQVVYGYLDDSGAGFSVKLSGFRNFASSYTVTTVASSDSAAGFMDALVGYDTGTNTLPYPSPGAISFGSGLWALSDASPSISAVSSNNEVTITGTARVALNRSTLAGIIISYTSGANNPPAVEADPKAPGNVIFLGQSFALKAEASGAPTLAYQWRKDGSAIAGATNAEYSVTVSKLSDTGSYDVVVTNAFGSATSKAATVTISDLAPPVIVKGLSPETLYTSYPATFSVTATGGQLAYIWKKDGVVIPGANLATYQISSVGTSDQGTYSVLVSNQVSTASTSANLTVVSAPENSYEAAVVSRRPLVYYRMSETSVPLQDPAKNSGALGTLGNGIYIGSVAKQVTGALASGSDFAAQFTGGRVVVPFAEGVNPNGSFSVEVWAKPANTGAGQRVLVQSMVNGEYAANTGDRSGWCLRQNGSSLVLLLGGANGYYDTNTAANVFTPDTWTHCVAVFNGPANKVTLYANGVEVSTLTLQVPFEPNTAAPVIVADRGYGGWTFNGSLDEVALYAVELTPEKILAHYQNGKSSSPQTAYDTLVKNDSALIYLRLNEGAFGANARNAGTLGAAWNGTYSDAGAKAGEPAIAINQAGPRSPAFPGFGTTNLSVGMTNGFLSAPRVDLPAGVTAVTWLYREEHDAADGDLSWLAWLGDGGFHMNPDGELRYHWKGGQWDWASNLKVPVQVWTFAALVVEPDKATVYMSDGTNLLSSVHSVTHAPMVTTSILGFGGNQPGRADRHYRGKLDESAVFDRALNAGEIGYLFSQATGAAIKVSLVPGGVLQDSKPSGTPYMAYNNGSTWVASNTDSATPNKTRTGVQQFSAANGSQITVPANADLNSTKGTIMFWVRAAAPIPGPGDEGAILVDRRLLGNAGGGDVIVLNDAGSIFVQAETPPGRTSANTFSTGYIPDDQWHHVAYVYDQTVTGSITIYIDGVLSASNPNVTNWAWPAAQQLEIGRSHDGYWKRFDGAMDDFRFYNRILTATEIGQVFANGATVDNTALKLRLNFDNTGIGQSVVWPVGVLESSPSLGADANWQAVPGATSPYPFLPGTNSLFFRARL